jgi:hypothetical protein
MFVNDNLLSLHIDPECAGVRPTHAIQTMESVVDLDHVWSFDLSSVAISTTSIVA